MRVWSSWGHSHNRVPHFLQAFSSRNRIRISQGNGENLEESPLPSGRCWWEDHSSQPLWACPKSSPLRKERLNQQRKGHHWRLLVNHHDSWVKEYHSFHLGEKRKEEKIFREKASLPSTNSMGGHSLQGGEWEVERSSSAGEGHSPKIQANCVLLRKLECPCPMLTLLAHKQASTNQNKVTKRNLKALVPIVTTHLNNDNHSNTSNTIHLPARLW